MVDYIRNHTGFEKISYIGHSVGSSQMFYALSYNCANIQNKINVFVALAPVAKVGGTLEDEFGISHAIAFNAIGFFSRMMDRWRALDTEFVNGADKLRESLEYPAMWFRYLEENGGINPF